jgi:hypothetical protein
MAVVMIGIDPHKASHTAVAINAAEQALGALRVRASAVQAERLLGWAQAWPERAWAVEGAGGIGHLLAQQLLPQGGCGAGCLGEVEVHVLCRPGCERVLDCLDLGPRWREQLRHRGDAGREQQVRRLQ